MIYLHVCKMMRSVEYSLPDPSYKGISPPGENNNDITEYLKSLDPSRVIYNGLVPFAVSMFEYFFSQAFQILIAYDEYALEKRTNHKQKIDFELLLELNNKRKTIENIIAEGYTFQNLDQINKAYKEWLNIDVRKILFKKKRIGNSIKFLENRVSEIIQFRHNIIHRFQIDQTLTKNDYINILNVIEKSISEFVKFIAKKYRIEIDTL